MHRQSRLFLVLASLVLVLAACGPNAEEDPAGNDDGGQPEGSEGVAASAGASADASAGGDQAVSGDLFAFGFSYETGDIIATTRADYFNEQYPDVNVSYSESGFDDQQFLSALQSGDPPDVVNIPRNKLGTYVARDVLMPLGDCLASAGMDMSMFREAAVNQVTVDGEVYALPEFFNSRVWILNDSVFEDAEVDPAEADLSDWDTIAQLNEQMTQTDGSLSRIGIDPKLPEFLPLWVHANGGQMLSEDGMESMLESPEVVEALEFTASLHEAAGGRAAFLDFRDTWDFFGAENQIASDQLGGFPMEQWYINVLSEVSPEEGVTVRPFQTREGEPITWADGNSWAIPQQSQNPEAACAFITTMVSTDAWVAAAEARAEERAAEGVPNTGVYTGNVEADEVIFGEIVDLSDTPTYQAAVEAVLEVQDSAFALPPTPAAAEFEQAWQAAVNRVLNEGADPAEALQQADEEAQAAIDQAAE